MVAGLLRCRTLRDRARCAPCQAAAVSTHLFCSARARTLRGIDLAGPLRPAALRGFRSPSDRRTRHVPPQLSGV